MSDFDFDDLDYLLNLLNQTQNTTDPPYVVPETVKLCTKHNVNKFGATFIPVFYFVTFILGYLGNGLVLFILYKYEKLQTVTDVFLLNLVVSNLLFTSTLPFLATYHRSEWIFGSFMCKAISSAYFIGYYSSILFLTLMTFDRYLAVVHAITAAKSRKKLYAVVSSLAVWLLSVVASLKEIIMRDVSKNQFIGLVCEDKGYSEEVINYWRLVTYYQQFFGFFLLPLFMVMFCYVSITVRILGTRMKKKCRTIKLIFLIIFTFFACWTPYNVVSLLRAIQISMAGKNADSCTVSDSLDYAFYVTRNWAYLYCTISPVFYCFVGKKFQSHFRRLLGKHVSCIERRPSLSSQTTKSSSQRFANSAYE